VAHTVIIDAAGQVERDTYTADGVNYDVQQILATGLEAATSITQPTELLNFALDNRLLRIGSTTINGVPVTPKTTFDVLGRPTVSVLPTGVTPLFSSTQIEGKFYDANGRLQAYAPASVIRINQPGQLQIFGFGIDHDPVSGRVSRVFDQTSLTPTGRQTTYLWNGDGQPNTITRHGVATTFGYDTVTGNVSSATDLTGAESWTYDAAGNVAARNDGTTTLSYGYDPGNRLTSIQDALGNVTTLGYGQGACGCPNGSLLTSVHTPDLAATTQWSFDYNADGLLLQSTDPRGASQNFTYTSSRDVQSVADALGRQTLFSYDQLGRPQTVTDALGRVGVFAYPVPGAGAIVGPSVYAGSGNNQAAPTDLTVSLADGQYQVGQNFYSPAGFPAQVEFYRDATFAFSLGRGYDLSQRLVIRGDRNGLPFAGSQILQQTTEAAQFREEQFAYLPNNDWSLLTQFEESDYTGRFEDESRSYNTELDLTSNTGWSSPSGTVNYTYTRDTAGRPTAIATTLQGGSGASFFNIPGPGASYTYDPTSGQLSHVTNGSGSQDLTYDARGLVKHVTLSFDAAQPAPQAEGMFAFQYDEVGRNIRIDYPDGHFRAQTYDPTGHLTSRCYDGYPAPATKRCYSADYDAVGNPITLDDPEGHTEVDYDTLDRVTEVWRTPSGGSRTLEEQYTYDALGALSKNVDTTVDDQRPVLGGTGKASAGVPATHNGQPVSLDGGGQITGLDSTTLSFNKRAGLIGLTQGSTTETYGYDSFSRRASRTISGTPTEFYSYEGPNIVAATTTDGSTPTLRRRILYEGVDQPLWMYDGSVLSSVYFELDTIGNVRRVRGGKALPTSTPLASDLGGYRYTAFGRLNTVDTTTPYPSAGGTRYDQPLRWQSHWFIDAGPGFYDFRARVWSPDLATFLQPDEYGFLSRTGTLWSWPGQNPFRWRDPSGRDASEWFLRNAQTLQNGAEAVSAAALTIATGGLAGELLGFGSLEATLGSLGFGATGGAASAATSGAAMAAPIVAKVVETECKEPAVADELESIASSIDPNKLNHIFGDPGHNLDPLLQQFGSQDSLFNAVRDSTQAAIESQGISGIFETTVNVGGQDVVVRGNAIDGIARIGTFFVP
jgi:RHS repeat-associated protein